MSMKLLKAEVKAAMDAELNCATIKFGAKHNSPHEAYGVLVEEMDEAQVSADITTQYLDAFFGFVQKNDIAVQNRHLEHMRDNALDTACEYIQVAAMCEKALRGYKTEEK